MKNFEEELTKAKETGKGLVVRFQEKPTFKFVLNSSDCPHCGERFGGVSRRINKDVYETPSDIEFMCINKGYAWTEDCICGICGEKYSQANGC